MNREESVSVWGNEKEVDEFYTTRFLELLLKYDYVWSPDAQLALSINLGEDKTAQFLLDFSNFVEGIDELKASKALTKIKEIYNEEYYKLLAASKNKNQSKFNWFSKAHELFRDSMVDKSSEGKVHEEPISSQIFPAIKSVAGEIFTPKKDPLSPTTEDLTDDDDPLSPPFEDLEDDRPPLPSSEIFIDEDTLLSIPEYFTDRRPLPETTQTFANAESLAFEIQSFNSNSLVSRHEALEDNNSLSSRDEAFMDTSSQSSLAENLTESDSLINTFENITKNFPSQEGRGCKNTISFSPDARRSPSPVFRRSFRTVSRLSLSPTFRSFTPDVRRSLSPASRKSLSSDVRRSLSPASRKSLSPASTKSLSPAFTKSFSSSRISPSQDAKTSLSPADRESFSSTTRRSFSPTVKNSSSAESSSPPANNKTTISPYAKVTRNSPVAGTSLSPLALYPPTTGISPPVSRRSLSPAYTTSTSHSTRASLSPTVKITFPSFPTNPAPTKPKRCVIEGPENLNISESVKGKNQMTSRSPTIPKRNSQPCIDSMKPTRCGNEITSCPTYSGIARILHKESLTKDSSSKDVKSASIHTNCPASEIKNHSSKSPSSQGILSRKEKSTSHPSSHVTGYLNLPRSCQPGTETTDSCGLDDSQVRSFVQSAALQTIKSVNSRSDFMVTGASRGIGSSGIFANAATDILEILPPRLASECAAFILHFLQEILKCK